MYHVIVNIINLTGKENQQFVPLEYEQLDHKPTVNGKQIIVSKNTSSGLKYFTITDYAFATGQEKFEYYKHTSQKNKNSVDYLSRSKRYPKNVVVHPSQLIELKIMNGSKLVDRILMGQLISIQMRKINLDRKTPSGQKQLVYILEAPPNDHGIIGISFSPNGNLAVLDNIHLEQVKKNKYKKIIE